MEEQREEERSGTAERGLTEEERQRAIDLIAEAESRKHSVACDRGKFRTIKKEREKVSLVCLANVDEEEVQWLYCPYVPRAKLTLCAAYPGVGKTYLLCYMAACVTTGKHFFNIVPFENGDPENVIYLTAEDGIGDTIKKRMRECGADMNRVYVVNENKTQLLFDSPEIEEFMKDLTNLETGDVVDVDWLPSRGTFVFYNGQLMGNPVRGKALYDAVLSIWLGNNSLEEKLREGLLSLPKEKTEN